ncbi:hypothetical protein MRX96_056483 [Rhipicephalus microplus]
MVLMAAAAATRDGASDLSSGPSVRKRAREWSGDLGPLIKGSAQAVQHIRTIASTLWPPATQLAEIWLEHEVARKVTYEEINVQTDEPSLREPT